MDKLYRVYLNVSEFCLSNNKNYNKAKAIEEHVRNVMIIEKKPRVESDILLLRICALTCSICKETDIKPLLLSTDFHNMTSDVININNCIISGNELVDISLCLNDYEKYRNLPCEYISIALQLENSGMRCICSLWKRCIDRNIPFFDDNTAKAISRINTKGQTNTFMGLVHSELKHIRQYDTPTTIPYFKNLATEKMADIQKFIKYFLDTSRINFAEVYRNKHDI